MPTSSPATQGGHLAAFAREYCRHTKGRWAGQPVAFEPWQQSFIDEAFRLDADGRRVYRNVLLGLPRKNGKSTLAATLALYMAGADGEAAAGEGLVEDRADGTHHEPWRAGAAREDEAAGPAGARPSLAACR
jgi:hypothetical protein